MIVHNEAVDIIVFYEYDIVRLQLIGFSFNYIIYAAADQDGDLIKFMIMVFYLFRLRVCQVKQTEFAV